MKTRLAVLATTMAALAAGPLRAQDVASFEKRISVERLENGLTVLLLERPGVPVFSFFTHVDAGSAQEVPGITGLAHMFEHMAFKGTDTIGTRDYAAESEALAKVEASYRAWDEARRRPVGRDEAEIASRKKTFDEAVAQADGYVKRNEFGEIIDQQGGVGLNAFTSADTTGYFYSLPSNRLELWAYLESERFLKPVFREFYKERDVVMEERRMRTDSNPIGRLIEEFLAGAFTAHPYGQPTIGYASDLQAFSATDAQRFFEARYVPSNMTVALVGDFDTVRARELVRTYFGRLPKRPKPEPLRTSEPPQRAEREIALVDPSQPFYVEGYHKPDALHPDDAVFDVIQDLMSNGRTSRLYRKLVRDDEIAAAAAGFNSFPGAKYPSLFVFYAIPVPGHTNAEIEQAIRKEIDRLKTEAVTESDLAMVKTRTKADLIRSLDSNAGLAQQLAGAQSLYGDWRELFRQVDRIDQVTAADVQRVARATFVATNRTVARIETRPAANEAESAGQKAEAK